MNSNRITWRTIERYLIDYLRMRHVPLADGGGSASIEVVLGVDETDWVSIEDLARRLTEELEP